MGATMLALCLSPAHAQDADDETAEGNADADSGLLDAPRNGFSLDALGTYTDNFYYQSDAAKKDSVYGALLRPRVEYANQSSKVDIRGLAEGEYATFDAPGTADDYLDGRGRLKATWLPTQRNRFDVGGFLQESHDPFGTSRTEAAPAIRDKDLDRWQLFTGSVDYIFGAPGAIQTAEVGATRVDKQYTTNETTTQVLDYSASSFNGALFYRATAKTALLVDYVQTVVSFDHPFSAGDRRSGRIYQVRGGIRWLATAQTSGDIRVGQRRRTYDSGDPATTGLDWEAGVDWSPAELTQFKLKTGRMEQESYVVGARLIDVRYGRLDWMQTWSARTQTTLGVNYDESDFVGQGRTDRSYGEEATLVYKALSYLSATMGLNYTDRESNAADRVYNRFAATLGIRLGY